MRKKARTAAEDRVRQAAADNDCSSAAAQRGTLRNIDDTVPLDATVPEEIRNAFRNALVWRANQVRSMEIEIRDTPSKADARAMKTRLDKLKASPLTPPDLVLSNLTLGQIGPLRNRRSSARRRGHRRHDARRDADQNRSQHHAANHGAGLSRDSARRSFARKAIRSRFTVFRRKGPSPARSSPSCPACISSRRRSVTARGRSSFSRRSMRTSCGDISPDFRPNCERRQNRRRTTPPKLRPNKRVVEKGGWLRRLIGNIVR